MERRRGVDRVRGGGIDVDSVCGEVRGRWRRRRGSGRGGATFVENSVVEDVPDRGGGLVRNGDVLFFDF